MAKPTSIEPTLASSAKTEDWRDRWQHQDAWTVREFAQLCCGWNPSVYAFPNRDLYNEALESINRAVRVKVLPTIELLWPATGAERLYDSVPMFRPHEVASWAAKRYPLPAFPYLPDAWEFEARVLGKSAEANSIEKPLGSRERATLLTIIAALAKGAGIDVSMASKAGEVIEALTTKIDARIAARTVEDHLKRIPDALERRGKLSS